MKRAKITATRSGSRAGAPTSAKLGCTTISVPANPTAQAAMRRRPTSSPSANRPSSSMMNGMTKAMAMASARGRNCSAVNIAPMPMMWRTVRIAVSCRRRPFIRNVPPVTTMTGVRTAA